jgi:HK97 gp10 family phage protein
MAGRSVVTFSTKGFRELEQAIVQELPKTTARGVMARAAVDAMKPMEEAMARGAPFDALDRDDDGRHLNETMRTKRVPARRSKGEVAVRTGPAPTGKRARANAGWQENGTAKMPAHPYARPAADSESMTVIERLQGSLVTQLGKTKARIAKRAARLRK